MSLLRSCWRGALSAGPLIAALVLLLAIVVHRLVPHMLPPEGYYKSSGEVLLADGRLIEMSHLIRFEHGRFHAITRQDDTVFENAGIVTHRNGLRLHVEEGSVHQLSPALADEMIFGMLHGRRVGGSIQLLQRGPCLRALETGQIFCPAAPTP